MELEKICNHCGLERKNTSTAAMEHNMGNTNMHAFCPATYKFSIQMGISINIERSEVMHTPVSYHGRTYTCSELDINST